MTPGPQAPTEDGAARVGPVRVGRRRRPSLLLVLAVVAGLVVASCGVGGYRLARSAYRGPVDEPGLSHPDPEVGRGDRGPVRDDVGPITRRFALLGSPRRATWQSGALDYGWASVGPSTLWWDVVVDLEPGRGRELADQFGAGPLDRPRIHRDLAPRVTAGPWVGNGALEQAIWSDGFAGPVFLDADHDQIILLLLKLP